jgi:hypothetical protein
MSLARPPEEARTAGAAGGTPVRRTAPILFDDFEPGTLMGEHALVYDAQQAQRWQAIFGATPEHGANGAPEAASMAVVNMMRAYLQVVAPRPPGNVHARQQLRMHALPRPGETMTVRVLCAHKELRRERRYVDLDVVGSGTDGRALFDGRISLIWAA